MTTTFYLKRKNGSEHGMIYFQFNHSKIKIKVTTGLKIEFKDWGNGKLKNTNATTRERLLLNTYREKWIDFLMKKFGKQAYIQIER